MFSRNAYSLLTSIATSGQVSAQKAQEMQSPWLKQNAG